MNEIIFTINPCVLGIFHISNHTSWRFVCPQPPLISVILSYFYISPWKSMFLLITPTCVNYAQRVVSFMFLMISYHIMHKVGNLWTNINDIIICLNIQKTSFKATISHVSTWMEETSQGL